jgi:putative membrane protein
LARAAGNTIDVVHQQCACGLQGEHFKMMRIPFRPSHDMGHDPDYRFSLANERTFLAWIRTALALNAGGLAVAGLLPQFAGLGRDLLAVALIGLGTVISVQSVIRWAKNEEAMRVDAPLPPSPLPAVLAIGVMLTTTVGLVFLLLEGRP